MAQTVSTPAPAAGSLDAERLDVYRLALEFQSFAAPQLLLMREAASMRDQLDRASASIVLNIAEGAGRRTGAEKSSFYAVALAAPRSVRRSSTSSPCAVFSPKTRTAAVARC